MEERRAGSGSPLPGNDREWHMRSRVRQPRNAISEERFGSVPLNGYLAIKVQDLAHPWDVVLDQKLTAAQKRMILASWASDASAVESRPGFRWLKGTPGPVPLSHVRSALLALDQIEACGAVADYRAVVPSPVNGGYPASV